MLKVIIGANTPKETILLKYMKPLEVAIITDEDYYTGELVMRTAASGQFEVISLSQPRIDSCWTDDDCDLEVQLLPRGQKVTIEVFNE